MRFSRFLTCILFSLLGSTLAPCGCTSPDPAPSRTHAPATLAPSVVTIPKSSVSGLPLPGPGGLAAPSGTGCNLSVLSWAGFAGAASYSFDDGQPSHIAHWPELKATGVPMTFYLCPPGTGTTDYEATWKDALAAGCELGNHTCKHQQLSAYPSAGAIAQDILQCSAYIENVLGQKQPCSFAYPFGDTGWKAAFSGKFVLARSVFSGTIKPLDSTDPLALPIFSVTASQTESDFNPALDKSIREKSWVIFMFHSILPGDNWYAGVNSAAVVNSLEHAKASGNLWLDTVERVGTYWLAEKQFATLQAQGDDTTRTWTWVLPNRFPQGAYLRVRTTGGILSQNGVKLPWNPHGFYEVSLDAGKLEWHP